MMAFVFALWRVSAVVYNSDGGGGGDVLAGGHGCALMSTLTHLALACLVT